MSRLEIILDERLNKNDKFESVSAIEREEDNDRDIHSLCFVFCD